VDVEVPPVSLPCHLFQGEILNRNAEAIGHQDGRVTAVRKKAGAGVAIWIPALVDVGAWLGDSRPLTRFLAREVEPFVRKLPFRFPGAQEGCLLRTLKSGASFVTIVMNTGDGARRCALEAPSGLAPDVIWGSPANFGPGGFALDRRATAVAVWQVKQ
jgi:hypothetical protein